MKQILLSAMLALVAVTSARATGDYYLSDSFIATNSTVTIPAGGTAASQATGGQTNLIQANYNNILTTKGALELKNSASMPIVTFSATGYETNSLAAAGCLATNIVDFACYPDIIALQRGYISATNIALMSAQFVWANSTNQQTVVFSLPTTNFFGARYIVPVDFRSINGTNPVVLQRFTRGGWYIEH